MKPGREVNLGWTFKRHVWEGKIQLGHAGTVQDHLLRSQRNTTPQAQALTQERRVGVQQHCEREQGHTWEVGVTTPARQHVAHNTYKPSYKGSGWQEACPKVLRTWVFCSIPCVSPARWVQSLIA